MKILAHVPNYMNGTIDGAVMMLHDYLRECVALGHDAIVLQDSDKRLGVWNGVDVVKDVRGNRAEYYPQADVVISHLGKQGRAWNNCVMYDKPLVIISHNARSSGLIRVHPEIGVVYNSHYLERVLNYGNDSVVCRPILNFDMCAPREGDAVTLVNLNADKGGEIFKEVAYYLDEYTYFGVHGYGNQIECDYNVRAFENGCNMADIFKATGILLLISKHESFGRVGLEAMACGIPVIACDVGGIREALGDAAIYVERTPQAVASAIHKLKTNIEHYDLFCKLAYNRAKQYQQDTTNDALLFIKFLENAARKNQHRSRLHRSKA